MAKAAFASLLLSTITFLLFLGTSCHKHDVTFSDSYVALGIIYVPYAEIEEPFLAYYNEPAKRSRIDYYNGMVTTFQRADLQPHGASYKIAPMTTEKFTNKKTCFLSNGTAAAQVKIQPLLPDLADYKILGEEYMEDVLCIKLRNVTTKGLKKNTYSMWVDKKTHYPVRYEMFGYDTLLGSHYDKYYFVYKAYTPYSPPLSTFDVPNNASCGGFPGPGMSATRALMNPMREFVHHDDQHVHEMFNDFKQKHSKMYESSVEHEQRKNNFRNNLRFIHSKNRAGLSYSLAVNHMTDRSNSEMMAMRGYRYTPGQHGGQSFNISKYHKVPESFDWRLFGAVTPVKDQGICGSCWSFGTTGTIEGAYFLKTGHLVRLSQQQLVDCSWGEGNNACDGGEDFRAYAWIKKHGLASEEKYGPYLQQDAYCHSTPATVIPTLKGFMNVTPGDADSLKAAIATHGPISVAMDAAHKSLAFYSNGVYYEPKCGNKPDQLDHAVLAVGYGTMDNQSYWLIKNSWSTHWGNAGYFLINQRDNNCGITTDPTYVLL